MHSVHLGVLQWLNASAIYELISFNYFGPQDLKLHEHLHELTRRLNYWCSMNRIRPVDVCSNKCVIVFGLFFKYTFDSKFYNNPTLEISNTSDP